MEFIDKYRIKLWQKKGQRLLQRGKSEKAKVCFKKILDLSNNPENLFNYALTEMNLFNYEKAIELFKEIREKNKDYFLNNLALAESYLIMKKWDDAEEIFYELSQKYPDNPNLKNYLIISGDVVKREKYVKVKKMMEKAVKCLKDKEYSHAIDYLKEAESTQPDIPYIKNSIGEIYMLQKDYALAFEYFKKVIAMEPDNPKFQKNWSKILRYVKK